MNKFITIAILFFFFFNDVKSQTVVNLKKNKSDYIFISAPENVAWILNIRGGDSPNSPVPNLRLIISKTNKIFLISKKDKCKKLIKNKIIKMNQLIDIDKFPKEILKLSGKSFIIDDKSFFSSTI